MTEKRFTTTGYYIYDHFKEDKWLVNEVEAQEIVDKMNNLDTKARENSKALSTLQKKYNALHEENEQLKSDNFNLNKSVEYLDEIVKEQCIKLDWASECGVKWDKEFKNWKGYE